MKVGKSTILIILITALFLLGMFTGYQFSKPKYITRVDTVQKIIRVPGIVVQRLPGTTTVRTKYDTTLKHDTLIKEVIIEKKKYYAAEPFMTSHNLVTKFNDSISLNYFYPEKEVRDLVVKPHPILDTTFITTKTQTRPLWLDITTHTAAAVLGYLIGK